MLLWPIQQRSLLGGYTKLTLSQSWGRLQCWILPNVDVDSLCMGTDQCRGPRFIIILNPGWSLGEMFSPHWHLYIRYGHQDWSCIAKHEHEYPFQTMS